MRVNVPYAHLDFLYMIGIGRDEDEICAKLIGKIDQIDLCETSQDEPSVRTKCRILRARTIDQYVHVDIEEI